MHAGKNPFPLSKTSSHAHLALAHAPVVQENDFLAFRQLAEQQRGPVAGGVAVAGDQEDGRPSGRWRAKPPVCQLASRDGCRPLRAPVHVWQLLGGRRQPHAIRLAKFDDVRLISRDCVCVCGGGRGLEGSRSWHSDGAMQAAKQERAASPGAGLQPGHQDARSRQLQRHPQLRGRGSSPGMQRNASGMPAA